MSGCGDGRPTTRPFRRARLQNRANALDPGACPWRCGCMSKKADAAPPK
jgi:hypothetical protein